MKPDRTAVGDGTNPALQTVLNPATMFANHGNNTNIVDWVFIEIRDKTTPATVVGTPNALVQKDGNVVDIDGSSCIQFPTLVSGDYYISVRHRNHLGAMTATSLPASTFTCSSPVVDFTTMTNEQLWNKPGYDGLEMQTITDGVTSRRALWACDADGNKKIKYTAPDDDAFKILLDMLLHPNNTGFDYNYDFGFGYWAGDLDMNSKVKYTAPDDDQFLLLVQLLLYPLNTTFDYNYDFFIEQLP